MARSRSPLLLLLLALACGGCEKKSDPVTSARLFFEQIGSGQIQAAYQNSAFGLQAQRNLVAFEATTKEMGLTNYANSVWDEPKIDGRTAKVSVRIQTRDGKEVPLLVTMTKESGTWRVFELRSPPSTPAGVSENRFSLVGATPTFTDDKGRVRTEGWRTLRVPQPIPPEAELRHLVMDTLLRFNEAIATKSFDAFYDSVSVAWQTGAYTQEKNQLTKGQLQRAFQPFIDQKVDIAGIKNVEPIWNSAVIVDPDGMLVLSGYYPTEPVRVHFALKFNYELPVWKLFAIDVTLRK